MRPTPDRSVTALATAVTMVAFASNSVLCRLALADGSIDPVGFTTIRLVSGVAILLAVACMSGRRRMAGNRGSWLSGLALFAYALGFSLAYVRLGAGVGALILFGCVQVTMLVSAFLGGERPNLLQRAGLLAAGAGLVALVLPGLSAPPLPGAACMAAAGIAWGAYSLRGRGAVDPVVATADNFVRAVPLAFGAAVVAAGSMHASARGIALAVASGAIASGLGYLLWYFALRGLSATRAASVQLTVPILAALGGVLFLSEQVTLRLAVASLLVLGGVGASLVGRLRQVR